MFMRTPDSIYEEIKRKIINLDLLPGTKVREEDLARGFYVSEGGFTVVPKNARL